MWENIVIRLNSAIAVDNYNDWCYIKHIQTPFSWTRLKDEIDPSLISAYYFSEFSGCITRFVRHLKLTVKLNKSCVHIRISNYNNIWHITQIILTLSQPDWPPETIYTVTVLYCIMIWHFRYVPWPAQCRVLYRSQRNGYIDCNERWGPGQARPGLRQR